MIEEQIGITVGNTKITATKSAPKSGTDNGVFIYAPGAGSNIRDPFGQHLHSRLPSAGIALVRFQFPYMEAGKRRPDAPRLLEETWRQVLEQVSVEHPVVVVGGRSMGGRIASQVVAQGVRVSGLALFAYPLRPPTNQSKVRNEHLPKLGIPMLFCSGTRDNFGTPDELREAASLVSQSTVHLLEGADHGFKVLKRSGRTQEEVWEEATACLVTWFGTVSPTTEPLSHKI